MDFKEERIGGKEIYDGKVIKVYVDDVKLPDGNSAKREYIRHSGGATVYCEKDNKILFVKQFRYAYGKEIIELPAGKINQGEQPLDTARRELIEECGIKAEKLELLFTAYPSPGYTDELIYIYKAEGLNKKAMNLDEDEFLTPIWIEKEVVKQMIKNGEINDAKTLIALLYMIKDIDEIKK